MKRVRVEEFKESLCKDCGWVNLVFSLKILFGSSLHFMGIRGIYTCVRMDCKELVFQNRASWQLGLMTWLSCEFKLQANWMANLDFLSCSATVGMTIQLLYMLHSCASYGDLTVTSHLRDPVASPCFNAQSWAFLHTLSHTTLTWFPPKYRVSKCWITSKLAWNKANKMVD